MIALGPLDNQGDLSILRSLTFITSAKSPVKNNIPCSQILEIGMWTSLGLERKVIILCTIFSKHLMTQEIDQALT